MSFSRFDHACMARAIRLARKGLFTTQPNPRVGCVITKNERVAGEGWHQFTGGPHAEIEALKAAGNEARGATAYVTLEPCSHHGQTAPCVEALIAAGINRVVVAAGDPNPLVNGHGLVSLNAAGIKVESGLMQSEAERLNAGFFKRMRQGLPWVRVKTATSLDGRTALKNGTSKWISSEEARRDVQRWRARSSAILTGIGTVLADNPHMTARVDGLTRQPIRVIADSRWQTPANSKILGDPSSAIIFGDGSIDIPPALSDSGVRCVPLPCENGRLSLRNLFQSLAEIEMNEVQVEAGAILCGSLLRDQLVDEILLYQAPVLLGDGGAGPFAFGPLESMQDRTHLTVLETIQIGHDMRFRLRPEQKPQ